MDRPTPSQQADLNNERTQAFLQNETWLRRVLYVRLQNSDDVDEVMQEVAMAVTKADDLPVGAIQPWLCRVGIRQALFFRRKRDRQKRIQQEYSNSSVKDVLPTSGDPLLWMLAGERRQQLQSALNQLNADDSNILQLKYVKGWNYQRICEHLEISHSAVANRLRAARQRLRTLLETED